MKRIGGFSPAVVIVTLIIFYLMICLPIFHAGFFSDDAQNSFVAANLELTHKSIWALCREINAGWISSGRLYPAAIFLGYPFHNLFPSQEAYQLARIVTLLISVSTVAWLVNIITKNIKITLLFLFLLPMFWTVRAFHDPLTSFGVMFAQELTASCLTLIGYLKYQETQKKVWFCVSVFAYLVALLTYEIGVTSFAAIVLLAWIDKINTRKFFQCIALYGILTLIYLGYCFMLRYQSVTIYDGVTFGTGHYFFLTFLKQFTGGIPLMYWFFGYRPLFSPDFFRFIFLPDFLWLLLVFLISYRAIYLLLDQEFLNTKQKARLFMIGLCFTVVPSVLIAISAKYQVMLSWGFAYLPVYLQYPGMCILLLLLLNHIHVKKRGQRALALLCAWITAFTLATNLNTVREQNNQWQNPRMLVEKALQSGLLNDLPKDAVIVRKPEYSEGWDNPSFYWQYARKIVDTMTITAKMQEINQKSHKENFLLALDNLPNSSDGEVLLGKIEKVHMQQTYGKMVIAQVTVRDPKIFFSFGQNPQVVMATLKRRISPFVPVHLNDPQQVISFSGNVDVNIEWDEREIAP